MRLRLAAMLLLILLGGCGFFRRQEKDYFSLETVPAAAPAAMTGLPVGVDSFELPPGIDRREIVVRQSDGQLDLRGTDLWAAPFESMIIHTLAFDLAGRAPEGMVVLPGQVKPVGAMRSIFVIAEKFEAGPQPVIVLDARWIVRTPGGAESIRHERIDVPINSLESEQIASGMSRALATLADRIVAALAGP